MPKKPIKGVQMDLRPTVQKKEVAAFERACSEMGESMTGVVRRLIVKVAAGDTELLQRIRS